MRIPASGTDILGTDVALGTGTVNLRLESQPGSIPGEREAEKCGAGIDDASQHQEHHTFEVGNCVTVSRETAPIVSETEVRR